MNFASDLNLLPVMNLSIISASYNTTSAWRMFRDTCMEPKLFVFRAGTFCELILDDVPGMDRSNLEGRLLIRDVVLCFLLLFSYVPTRAIA